MMTWLLGLTVKATLLLLSLALAGAVVRRSPAATRHFVWFSGLAALLLLPILVAVTPGWSPGWAAGWLPESLISDAPQTTHEPARMEAFVFVGSADLMLNEVAGEGSAGAAVGSQAWATDDPVGPTARSSSGVSSASTSFWLIFAWGVGVVAMLCRLVVGFGRRANLARGARAIEAGPMLDTGKVAAEALGLRRRVRLFLGDTTVVPMTWGVVRPVLYLPAAAKNWSERRLKTVLLHELAHIKRHDSLSRTLAQLACSVFWFHPLAWLSARRMLREQERACDDVVILAGADPHHYAETLVAIAREFRSPRPSVVGALAFARRSNLEHRVLSILDPLERRKKLSFFRKVLMLVLFAGLALPLAALHPTASAQQPDARPQAEQKSKPAADQKTDPQAAQKSKPRPTSVVVPRADPTPQAGVVVRRASAPAPQVGVVVPRADAAPQVGVVVPRADTAPQVGVVVPRAGAAPQAGVVVPRADATPQVGVAVPRAAAAPQVGVAVGRADASAPQVAGAAARSAGSSVGIGTAASGSGSAVAGSGISTTGIGVGAPRASSGVAGVGVAVPRASSGSTAVGAVAPRASSGATGIGSAPRRAGAPVPQSGVVWTQRRPSRIQLEAEDAIRIADNVSDVELGAGGWVTLTEGERRLEIRDSSDGAREFVYTVDGVEGDFDDEARAWANEILEHVAEMGTLRGNIFISTSRDEVSGEVASVVIEPLELSIEDLDLSTEISVRALESINESLELSVAHLELTEEPLRVTVERLETLPESMAVSIGTLETVPESLSVTLEALETLPESLAVSIDSLELANEALVLSVEPLELATESLTLAMEPLELAIELPRLREMGVSRFDRVFTWSEGDSRYAAMWRGRVELGESIDAIDLGADDALVIDERASDGVHRRLHVSGSDGGEPVFEWFIDGEAADFDDTGRAWLRPILEWLDENGGR